MLSLSDPRIKYLIPIIGSPDYYTLLTDRARRIEERMRGGSATTTLPVPVVPLAPPHFPPLLEQLVLGKDPTNAPLATWIGKHILVISGGRDNLVPFIAGGSAALVDKLKVQLGSRVDIDVMIDDEAGHALTRPMIDRIVLWIQALL
jgi:hypothetical protein